jgi:hypothetical protein
MLQSYRNRRIRKRYYGGKKMRKKTIFGMLVVGIFLFAGISQMVLADDPPRSPGAQWYWIVHDDESTSTVNPEVQHVWSDNSVWTDYIRWGPYDEVWYTAFCCNEHPYGGTIRPISMEDNWKSNTWLGVDCELSESVLTLYLTIYAPMCDNTEYFNWSILNSQKEGFRTYFQVTAYETGNPEEVIEQFTITFGESGKEKLDAWLTDFSLQLEFYRVPI